MLRFAKHVHHYRSPIHNDRAQRDCKDHFGENDPFAKKARLDVTEMKSVGKQKGSGTSGWKRKILIKNMILCIHFLYVDAQHSRLI